LFLDNVSEDANSCGTFQYLEIGSNCYIGDSVYLDLADRIIIGDDTMISGRTSLVTHSDCNRSPFLAARFPRRSAPIRIERGAWIGFGATLLDGVTIGEQSVVGAGSLVRANVPPREVWVGTPARLAHRIG
jgi:acetyltransferase-like isoleucine patch superfamily enzyme